MHLDHTRTDGEHQTAQFAGFSTYPQKGHQIMIPRDSISISCVFLLLLAGCVEPQPDPAFERVKAACDAGDTQACAVILEQQQRYREGYAAMTANIGRPVSAQPYMVPTAQPTMQPLTTGMKVCPNGMIVQQFYLC